MSTKSLSAIFAASLIASAQFSVQAQTAGAGAGAATSGAKGAITHNMVLGAVAGLAVIAALNSGNGGPTASLTNQTSTTAATFATAAVTQATATLNAATSFSSLLASSSPSINTSDLTTAIASLQDKNQQAQVAASDLAVASRTIAAVFSNGNQICAASVCTNTEILGLSFKAANTAKAAAEAALYVNTVMQAINILAAKELSNSTVIAQLAALTETVRVASLASQTAANLAIEAYQAVAAATGTTGTTITASKGTTGTTGPTGTY